MYKSEFCEVSYLKNKNAILCRWKAFCKGDDYRKPFKFGLKFIHEKKATTWITDTTNGFENEEADTRWLLETFIPQVIESSIDTIIFIIEEDSSLMDEIEGQVESLRKFFEVKLVEGLNDKFE